MVQSGVVFELPSENVVVGQNGPIIKSELTFGNGCKCFIQER